MPKVFEIIGVLRSSSLIIFSENIWIEKPLSESFNRLGNGTLIDSAAEQENA